MLLKIRHLLIRYFWKRILKFHIFYYTYFINKSKDIIIILSPGKVGSSSVYKSIKKKISNSYIFHVHFLTEKNINHGINYHRNSKRKSVPYHFISSIICSSFFIKRNEKIKVIVLFREPIARFISDFYQNSNRLVSQINSLNNKKILKKINLGISKMDHMDYLENWVIDELKLNLNYDLFKKSMLRDKEFFIDKTKNISFLFFKMEYLDKEFENASKIFFNQKIKLIKQNISSKKDYFYYYSKAKKMVEVNKSVIDEMRKYNYTKTIYPINSEKE